MSGDSSESTVSLQNVRLIARLHRGEPGALDALWDEWKGAIWSVCSAMGSDRGQSVDLLKRIYARLGADARGWTTRQCVGCLVANLVFQVIADALELPRLDGISPTIPEDALVPGTGQIHETIGTLPPTVRLVYVLDLFFRCPAHDLAPMVGEDELELRMARASAAYALVSGGGA